MFSNVKAIYDSDEEGYDRLYQKGLEAEAERLRQQIHEDCLNAMLNAPPVTYEECCESGFFPIPQ